MNPFTRCIAVLAALSTVVCVVCINHRQPDSDQDRIDNPISQEESQPVTFTSFEGQRTEEPADSPAPTRSNPTDWSDAVTLQSEFIPIDGHPQHFERRRLVQSPDFDPPLLLIEGVTVDSVEGVIVNELYDSMIANQMVVSSPTPIDTTLLKELLVNTGWTLEWVSRNGLISLLGSPSADLHTVKNGLSSLQSSLAESPDLSVEPNRIYYAAITEPNDPLYLSDQLWGLNNDNDNDVDAPEGWGIRTDASDIIIAITDTGIREDHEDLIDNLWTNTDEISENGIDDDNNGYIDDKFGTNILDTSLTASDDNGHGTLVAGIAGASGNNGIGVSGVAWQTNLMAVKFMNASGRGTLEDAIEAIDYALENGADIINASWGSPGESPSLELAIERALDAGVFIVAAAGNESNNIDQTYYHPASSVSPNVITVASINESGNRSGFSNYGIGAADLAAPGSNILSTSHLSADAYALDSGTSLAAPYVSGVLALNLSLRPEDDLQTHVDRLIVSSKQREGLSDVSKSQGLVSLYNSLSMDTVPYPPTIESHSELMVFELAGEDVTLSVVVNSNSPVTFEWFFENNLLSGETSDELSLPSIAELNQGTYRFVATNEDGEVSIEFDLNVLTPDPDLVDGLDADPATLVFTPNDTLWSLAFDPLSRDGDHIEGGYPSAKYEKNTLSAIVRGPGELRFLWKLTGVDGSPNSPDFSVDGLEVASYITRNQWRIVEFTLEEEKDYELSWSFLNRRDLNVENGKLLIDYLKIFPIGQAPPIIYEHPRGASVKPFERVIMGARASGQDLSYQWYHNDLPIESRLDWRLRISEATTETEGDYHVVVSNAWGSDTSLPATLDVDESQTPARFIETEASFKGIVGERLDLSLEHVGSPPITYKWLKDGIEVPGQTGPVLSLNPLRKEHRGGYELQIENQYGRREYSNTISVNVVDRDLAPDSVLEEREIYQSERPEGQDINHSYWLATEFHPLEFQWYLDGVPVEGQNSPTLSIENAQHEDGGIYSLEFKNDRGTFRDDVLEVIVNFPMEEALDYPKAGWFDQGLEDYGWIKSQREISYDGEDALEYSRKYVFDRRTNFDDGGFTDYIANTFVGPKNLSFYWKRSSEEGWFQTHVGPYTNDTVPANQSTNLIESDVALGDWQKGVLHVPAGEHQVYWGFLGLTPEVKGWLDRVQDTNAPAIVSRIPPTIVSGVNGVTVTAEAWGPGTITHQWYKNGVPLAGETSESIAIEHGSATPEDTFNVVVGSEHGSSSSTPFQVISIQDIVDGEGFDITVGGNVVWEENSAWGENSLRITLGPEEKSWIEFETTEPTILSINRGDFKVYVDNTPVDLIDWTGFNTGYLQYTHIPAGNHTVRIEVKGDPLYGRPLTRYIQDIQVSPAPLIISNIGSRTARPGFSDYKVNVRADFAAKVPATVRWYKDDVLTKEETAQMSGSADYFFEDWYSRSIEDAGTYVCEITDADGNTRQSDEIVVREVDTLSFGDVVGDNSLKIGSMSSPFRVDTEVFVEGNASAHTTFTSRNEFGHLQIYREYLEGASYPSTELKVRLSGYDEETKVTISNGESFRSDLALTEEWQSIRVKGDSSSIYFEIEKSRFSNLELWIDDVTSDASLRIDNHPKHYATYLDGSASFSVEAYSPDSISYQWRHNKENIPGATSTTYEINSLTIEDLGEYDVVVITPSEQVISNTVELSIVEDLGAALEMPGLRVSTWGDALWSIDKSVSIDGTNSLRSGEIEPGEVSSLRIEFDFPALWSVYMNTETLSGEKQRWETRGGIIQSNGHSEVFTMSREDAANPFRNGRFLRIDRLSMSALSLQSYNRWLENSSYITGAATYSDSLFDELEDSDDDGLANYLEYLFDLDPFISSRLPPIVFRLAGDQVQAVMDYRFAATGEYVIQFETSENLEDWEIIRSENSQILDETSSYFDVESIIDVPTSSKGPQFFRTKVTKTGPSGDSLESQ